MDSVPVRTAWGRDAALAASAQTPAPSELEPAAMVYLPGRLQGRNIPRPPTSGGRALVQGKLPCRFYRLNIGGAGGDLSGR
jgi:hypothetical protein